MNRRKFLIQTGAVTAGCLVGNVFSGCASLAASAGSGFGKGVTLVRDPADPIASSAPAGWAVEQLRLTLVKQGFDVRVVARLDEARPTDLCIVATGRASALVRDAGMAVPDAPEALALAPARLGSRDVLLAVGSDARGLTYALTEIADAVALAADPAAAFTALQPANGVVETPANKIRSVMRMFVSDVEDKGWYNDREFWRSYLTMLATQRFNRFNLAFGLGYDAPSGLRDTYLYFAYPFLLSVPGYDVRATNLPDAERDRNLEMLRFISDEAALRGLQFQLGLWTHAYQWTNSPNANHVITGLTPQTQAPYSRDALAIILKECPGITGVTFRIHGESGVPEGSYDLWKTIFDGCVRSGRKIEIDMHAKGMDQPTIDAALGTGLPVNISPKFWAEHMGLPYHQAAIRPTELPTRPRGTGLFAQSSGARSFLRYGYGDLLTEDRKYGILHRIWPGTQRVLLWGDPKFAAAYSRAGSFCGSLGHEIFDPLSFKGRKGSGLPGGRDGYADLSLRAPGGDFEKYRYTYRLWGRMLYNPDTQPEVWQRQLRNDYKTAGNAAERALASASRILPLITSAHLPSAANNNFWAEMPANMSIVDASHPDPYTDTPNPKRFGGVSPLDPQLFYRVEDYADDLLKGTVSGKYTPVEVAQWLKQLGFDAVYSLHPLADVARRQILRLAGESDPEPAWSRLELDVMIQAGLGGYFERKYRAAVLFALFERTGSPVALSSATTCYYQARASWDWLTDMTKKTYVTDMTYGDGWFQRGNWGDRLVAIDRDIAAMEQKKSTPAPQLTMPGIPPEKLAALVASVLADPPERPAPGVTHTAPAAFHRREPVALTLAPLPGPPLLKAALLHYRHANQAEPWLSLPMTADAGGFRATIPADYADSHFALTYYFELTHTTGTPTLYPGLAPTLDNQPYFLLRAATA